MCVWYIWTKTKTWHCCTSTSYVSETFEQLKHAPLFHAQTANLLFHSFCTLSELNTHISYSNSRSLIQRTYTHAAFLKLGFVPSHLYISNLLLSLYLKTVDLYHAHKLFDEMSHKDITSWTTIISSHAQAQHGAIYTMLHCKVFKRCFWLTLV